MVDYFSFEDVLRELELSEEDLKRMVSEGELRAFRDENKMKFKKEDVENLKKGRITEPTIILPSTPSGQQDETVLDLDIGEETSALSRETAQSPAVRPPPPAVDDDLLVTPEDEKTGIDADETFIEEETDTGLTTEPLKLADEVEAAETLESESVTEELVEAGPAKMSGRRRAVRRTGALPMATEDEIEKRRAHPVWTFFCIIAFLLAGTSGFFIYDLLMMENGRQDQPSGLTAGLAGWTLEQFWGDQEWRKFHDRESPGGKLQAPQLTVEVAGYTQRPIPVPDANQGWYGGPSFKKPDHLPSAADSTP